MEWDQNWTWPSLHSYIHMCQILIYFHQFTRSWVIIQTLLFSQIQGKRGGITLRKISWVWPNSNFTFLSLLYTLLCHMCKILFGSIDPFRSYHPDIVIFPNFKQKGAITLPKLLYILYNNKYVEKIIWIHQLFLELSSGHGKSNRQTDGCTDWPTSSLLYTHSHPLKLCL